MNKKDVALMNYLEFNLIGLIEEIRPHIKDDTNIEDIYRLAYNMHDDIKKTVAEPSGLMSERN